MSPDSAQRADAAQTEALLDEWRELAVRYARVNEALERDLQRSHGLGRTEYDVLARLDEAASCMGRVTELAGEVGLSQSALSRLVDRLQAQGLVDRVCCTDDRRGVYVGLTDLGRARLGEARPTYASVLARVLAS